MSKMLLSIKAFRTCEISVTIASEEKRGGERAYAQSWFLSAEPNVVRECLQLYTEHVRVH